MDSEKKYYWDETPLETEQDKVSEDVSQILQMFDVLSVEDKVKIKKLIKNRDLFG